MTWRRVGILTHNENLDLIQRVGEGAQHIVAGGKKTVTFCDFLAERAPEAMNSLLNGGECLRPRGVDDLAKRPGGIGEF